MKRFQSPEFSNLPADIIDDFNGCFQDNLSDIQDCIAQLECNPSPENIHQLFRHMHSLKGNCKMVNLDQSADVVHALEDIVTDIRAEKHPYTTDVGDLILAGIVQIEQLNSELRQSGSASADQLEAMLRGIQAIKGSSDSERQQALEQALRDLGAATLPPEGAVAAPDQTSAQDLDLLFFHNMAHRIDQLSIYWRRRTQETTQLARELNQRLGQVADPLQLEAAVCVHDMGMALIPHTIFNKQTELVDAEQKIVKGHIDSGADMLARIPGWADAADAVRQHHERYDGSGYPRGLAATAISPGARIISIVDTFYAVTNERPDRSYRRSLLSAMSEINGNVGTQFDPGYVEAFNQVVREHFIGNRAGD